MTTKYDDWRYENPLELEKDIQFDPPWWNKERNRWEVEMTVEVNDYQGYGPPSTMDQYKDLFEEDCIKLRDWLNVQIERMNNNPQPTQN